MCSSGLRCADDCVKTLGNGTNSSHLIIVIVPCRSVLGGVSLVKSFDLLDIDRAISNGKLYFTVSRTCEGDRVAVSNRRCRDLNNTLLGCSALVSSNDSITRRVSHTNSMTLVDRDSTLVSLGAVLNRNGDLLVRVTTTSSIGKVNSLTFQQVISNNLTQLGTVDCIIVTVSVCYVFNTQSTCIYRLSIFTRRSDTILSSVHTLLSHNAYLLQGVIQFLGTDCTARNEGDYRSVISSTLNKQKRPISWGAVKCNSSIVSKGVVNQSSALSNVTRDNLWVGGVGSRSSILL